MINNKDKLALFQRIIASESFHNSHLYQDLLEYLVNASIENKTPKEYTIATDVFRKGPEFDPSQDTIVRVYIYNLRKKLDQYYNHEGSKEDIRLEIPKGHYELNFKQNKPIKKQNRKNVLFILLLCLLGAGNLLFLYKLLLSPHSDTDGNPYLKSPIWANFLNNPNPKQIVLGDHFFFIKDSNSFAKRTIMRKDDINTEREFEAYRLNNNITDNLKPLTYPMFPRNSVWPFADIIELFVKTHREYSLNYASHVSAADMKSASMLFIGSFHTLAGLNQTFRNSRIEYRVYSNELKYYDVEHDSLIVCPEEGDPLSHHVDYGIARKIPAPNNNIIFIFTSFHETGTVGIVRTFTNPESLKKLENQMRDHFGHVPDFFEVVFKASGYNRTVYDTEIIYMKEITSNENFW